MIYVYFLPDHFKVDRYIISESIIFETLYFYSAIEKMHLIGSTALPVLYIHEQLSRSDVSSLQTSVSVRSSTSLVVLLAVAIRDKRQPP